MHEQELNELGLSSNEIKIYLSLLKSGMLNPTQLAEKTGLHRSYVYDTLERLLEKGIINTVLTNNKKNYQAVDPKVLREIFELKLKQLDKIIPELSSLFESKKEETRIELHKGKKVYGVLIRDLTVNLKKNDVVYIFGADENILGSVEPIYLKQYFNIIKEKEVKEKVIITKGSKRFRESNVEYKELDKKYIGSTTTVINQRKVFLFTWEDPYYLIVIDSKRIAEDYQKQFNLLWKIAK
ncbi:MAG: helix-turn-helix domain-containing protein [Nanoarchaeota archaeon]